MSPEIPHRKTNNGSLPHQPFSGANCVWLGRLDHKIRLKNINKWIEPQASTKESSSPILTFCPYLICRYCKSKYFISDFDIIRYQFRYQPILILIYATVFPQNWVKYLWMPQAIPSYLAKTQELLYQNIQKCQNIQKYSFCRYCPNTSDSNINRHRYRPADIYIYLSVQTNKVWD